MGSGIEMRAAGCSIALSSYYVRHFFLDDPEGMLNDSQNAMSLEISLGEVKGAPDDVPAHYRIVMNIYVDAGPEEPTADSPCRLGVVGEFRSTVQGDVSAESVHDFLREEGAQELYSMAKSTMASLTASSPIGTIMLPSVSFGA